MLAARQAESILLIVANDVGPSQPGIDVETRLAYGMIVIPKRAGLLLVGIRVCLLGPFGSTPFEPCGEPCIWLPVAFGRHDGAMDMHNGLRCRLAVGGAVQVRIERLRDEKIGADDFVSPPDKDSLPAPNLERGPGKLAAIAPKLGRGQVTVEALTNGPGRDIVERTAFQYADLSSLVQPRQRIDKFPQERASGLPGASSVSPDRP